MTPINSFDNPSVISIQGTHERILLKKIAFGVCLVAFIWLLFKLYDYFFVKKQMDNLVKDSSRRVHAFLNPPFDPKLDGEKDLTKRKA